MASVTATADSVTVADYDYENARRVVRSIQRAAADPVYLEALLSVYREAGYGDYADKFAAAVEEQRTFAALEAEFGDAGELVSA